MYIYAKNSHGIIDSLSSTEKCMYMVCQLMLIVYSLCFSGSCPSTSHAFSPWIVATTFLECRLALNSRYQIPCHVPVASRPFVIGIVTLAPTKADFICAYPKNISNHPYPISGNGGEVQAYHPPPPHYAYKDSPSYHTAQSCPAHHSYQRAHPRPNSRSATMRRRYVE